MTAYIERDESGTNKVHDAREKLESLSTVDITAVFKKVGTAGYKNRYHKFDPMLGLRSVSVPLLCCRHIMGKNLI